MAQWMQDTASTGQNEFSYPIFVKEVFMPKISGKNNANIRKWSKKYDIKIKCNKEGQRHPHFVLTGPKPNVQKAMDTIKSNFAHYLYTPKIDDEPEIDDTAKQYDLRLFKSISCLNHKVIKIIGQYYYSVSVGTVKIWFPERYFGFIKVHSTSNDVFVHSNGIIRNPKKSKKHKSLQRGEMVEFAVVHHMKDNEETTRAICVTGPNGQRVNGYCVDAEVKEEQVKIKKWGSNINAKNRNAQTKERLAEASHSSRIWTKDGSFAQHGAVAFDPANDYQKEDWNARKSATKSVATNKQFLGNGPKKHHRKRKLRKIKIRK
eukprot:68350_1